MDQDQGIRRKDGSVAVVERTPNHLYAHCTSVIMVGMEGDGDTRAILQLGHDITELADGSTKGDDIVRTVRHTFATVSMDRKAAQELSNALYAILGIAPQNIGE